MSWHNFSGAASYRCLYQHANPCGIRACFMESPTSHPQCSKCFWPPTYGTAISFDQQ